jgi:hypothetical protein
MLQHSSKGEELMRLAIPVTFVLATALSVVVAAQDSKVKSRTNIKADDAQVVSMTGCLRQDAVTNGYTLEGTMAAAGKDITTSSTVKTDVDRDKTTVKGKSQTKGDEGAVATSGVISSYALVPGNVAELSAHVGEQVQVSAIMVKPGHGDADVKITEKTKVEPEHADDSTSRSKTKTELPRSPAGQYSVVSVTPLGTSCTP